MSTPGENLDPEQWPALLEAVRAVAAQVAAQDL